MWKLCLTLHICWRPRLVNDYNFTLGKWAQAETSFRVQFVDSCLPTTSHPLDYLGIPRVPFQQKTKPLDRFYLSGVEREQMRASLEHLAHSNQSCELLGKLTGKYFSDDIISTLNALVQAPQKPILGLQYRGPQYGGYSSELFVVERSLFMTMLPIWPKGWNTEKFVQLLYTIANTTRPEGVHTFPRLQLDRVVRRSGNNLRMTFL